MKYSLKETIMKRDNISSDAADELITMAKTELNNLLFKGELAEAEYICELYFGLEPDYLDELIPI